MKYIYKHYLLKLPTCASEVPKNNVNRCGMLIITLPPIVLQVLIIAQTFIFNYACCQVLANNNLFTQKSNCIGRFQVEKCVSLFVQAQNVTYFLVGDLNQYMMKTCDTLITFRHKYKF